jgi:hypothetical protein
MDDLEKLTRSRDYWHSVTRVNRERMKRLRELAETMAETATEGLTVPLAEPGETFEDGLRAALAVALEFANMKGLNSDIALGARRAAFQIEQVIRARGSKA